MDVLQENISARENELDGILEQAKGKLEEIAGLTREAAKQELVNIVENEDPRSLNLIKVLKSSETR